MREVEKEYPGDSGPNWVIDLEGPDGNVFALWGILKEFADLYDWGGEKMIAESKIGGHYANPEDCPLEGYECVLDYIIYHLSPSPAGVEFRMRGEIVENALDYRSLI